MRLSEVTGLRVAVWGAGREGREALRVLGAANDVVLVVDDPAEHGARALASDAGVALRAATVETLCEVDVIVRSPGVSRYRSELAATRAAGVEDTGLVALWLAERGPAGTIGVTGTKGKSTTSWLCRAVLEAAGHPAVLAGNIGVPVTTVDAAAPLVVVEVSSYQAADVVTSPQVGVLTALGEDHLPWHGSVAQYRADKLNLFAHAGLRTLVVEATDATAVAATADRAEQVVTGTGRWRLHGSSLVAGDERVELGEVLGRAHHALDALLAVTAAEAVAGPLPPSAIATVVDGFTGLPARQQLVAVHRGVRYVDDALASNPAATVAALEAFARPGTGVVLLLGGADRGVDHASLVGALQGRASAVVLFSATGTRLAGVVGATGVPAVVLDTDDVADAVVAAADLAAPGAVVLFSPAAPTPAEIGTYEHRSARFAEAVRSLA